MIASTVMIAGLVAPFRIRRARGGLWVGSGAWGWGTCGREKDQWQDKSHDVWLGRSGFAEQNFNDLETTPAMCVNERRGVAEVNYGAELDFSHLGPLS